MTYRVHDAIRQTIIDAPQRFIVRNSGFVITCANIEVDDAAKLVTLLEPSIINGSQSQGEIRAHFAGLADNAEDPGTSGEPPFYVRATIIVDDDPDEVTETAIARNVVTPVRSISTAGAREQLDELEASIQKVIPGAKIRKSESHSGDDFIDTRFVLQLARVLMPTSLSGNPSAAEKLRAYKNPEQCLTDFCDWEENRKQDPASKAKYEFTVQIAPHALNEYKHWERHPEWNGHNIWSETKRGGRAVRRDSSGKIIWVSPALIFPLMGALSEFVVRKTTSAGKIKLIGTWRIEKPSLFDEAEMIQGVVEQFRAHKSELILMGRSEGAYSAVRLYPRALVKALDAVSASH